jgi:hypothetical protein
MRLASAIIAGALQRRERMTADGVSCPLEAVFLTVDRQPEYIHTTLKSFLETDPAAALLLPVKILVGGPGIPDSLRRYEEEGLARLIPLTMEEWDRMEAFPAPEGKRVHHRYNTNYHRALATERDPGKSLLVFEDDLSFTLHWLQKLVRELERIDPEGGREFMMTLYSSFPFVGHGGLDRVPHGCFYGTQAMYYPRTLVPKLAFFFHFMGVANFGAPGDLVVRGYCEKEGTVLLRTRHSLVQHEGAVTTGLSTGTHRSPTFVA